MNEVKKCSISGVAFTLDTDAYDTLNTYLESLKKSYKDTADGAEIVADIEARIAELILSTHDNSRVVEKPLIDNIITQMGSPEDIAEQEYETAPNGEPRIPRRLYRDMENAKLGGVCAGIGRYFDTDPVWVRLGLFLPILLTCFQWIPFLHWTGSTMGNLFGIFVICYFIMWFAVPPARTARQKLEMTGERINEQSIRQTTVAASNDPDRKAKPIVAEAVSVFGKVILILLKIFAGFIVFGLIMTACALILGIFAIGVGGEELFSPEIMGAGISPWLGCFAIVAILIPVILLIYVLMCLIASRKPSGKSVLIIFLLWLVSIISCTVIAVREKPWKEIMGKRSRFEQFMNSQVIVNSDTTTVRDFLDNPDVDRIVQENGTTLHVSSPDNNVDISFDKQQAALTVDDNGEKTSVKISVAKSPDKENPPSENPKQGNE